MASLRSVNEQRAEHLTPDQRTALETELAELEGPRRREIIEAIKRAREFGDIAENFEYHAAKNEQGLLERRIHILKDRLHHAVTVEHETDDHVGVGSIVEVEDGEGETDGGRDLGRRRRLPGLAARRRADGREGRRRRRRPGAERVVAGPRARNPARMRPETVELLSWVSRQPRSYPEAIEVWRTNCPQHSVWEDVLDAGLIEIVRNGAEATVSLTSLGQAALDAART